MEVDIAVAGRGVAGDHARSVTGAANPGARIGVGDTLEALGMVALVASADRSAIGNGANAMARAGDSGARVGGCCRHTGLSRAADQTGVAGAILVASATFAAGRIVDHTVADAANQSYGHERP